MSIQSIHKSLNPKDNFFVISGCSGSGKSTLLEALRAKGKTVVMEAGRRVVKEEVTAGRDGLPWENNQRFIELCVRMGIEDFDSHSLSKEQVFFDRSLLEFAKAEILNQEIKTVLNNALSSRRYAPLVFMSEPWEALFQSDEERQHSFKDAVAEYEVLVPTYQSFGYNIEYLPQTSVQNRVSFITSTLRAYQASS